MVRKVAGDRATLVLFVPFDALKLHKNALKKLKLFADVCYAPKQKKENIEM
jgi:hypothetical protein